MGATSLPPLNHLLICTYPHGLDYQPLLLGWYHRHLLLLGCLEALSELLIGQISGLGAVIGGNYSSIVFLILASEHK